MKNFIKLTVLTLVTSALLNAGTVKVGNQIKIKTPGSTSVNVSDGNININAQDSETKNSSKKARSTKGKKIVINGASITKTVTLNGESLEITGASNHITVKGNVASLTVNGADNTVNLDSVSSINVYGASNKIYYKTAPSKSGKPSISVTGADSTVSKR